MVCALPPNILIVHLAVQRSITVDLGEVKTAPTECKEKCFQMSHLPIFAIVKRFKMF